ncbi:hypothetical protein F4775DRAFT_341414 [Biscogniauxia sp. FL1348]|nr:hypothetical protein F4775DRAFT_341414 [Biscogniauxia sp. FL1348]
MTGGVEDRWQRMTLYIWVEGRVEVGCMYCQVPLSPDSAGRTISLLLYLSLSLFFFLPFSFFLFSLLFFTYQIKSTFLFVPSAYRFISLVITVVSELIGND